MKTLRSLGAVLFIIMPLFVSPLSAQTLTTLWHFTGGADGGNPQSGLVQGTDGIFYGTTFQGGNTNLNNGNGYGVVFHISPGGTPTNLHVFNGSDGAFASAALAQGIDGNFYGTTYQGGAYSKGTVFRISPSGNFSNLWSFTGGSDGMNPLNAVLVQGNDGNFYGTTLGGGVYGKGTVFRISPSGNLSNLWSFTGGADGRTPHQKLVRGSDGNFYGTTPTGGNTNSNPFGLGTVFQISPSGNLTNIYSFTDTGGDVPYAGLVRGCDGNLYGTTAIMPTAFRFGPDLVLTSLCTFCSESSCAVDGIPRAVLLQGSDGNFYGTTGSTSASTGTVFRMSQNGELTFLHSFIGSDGADPYAELVQGSDGNFYGTTRAGGLYNRGTIFRLSVPLNPPANQVSAIQTTGNAVAVSISSVAGETYQLQFTTDLGSSNWANVAGSCVSNSIGAVMTLTNFGGAVGLQGFYRFDITP